jgi:hypothetical protein
MKRALLLVLSISCFTVACSLGWREFRENLHGMEGRSFETMVSWLGAPHRSVEVSADRTAHTWRRYNAGGDHMCDVTATVDRGTGTIIRITDNCPNWR